MEHHSRRERTTDIAQTPAELLSHQQTTTFAAHREWDPDTTADLSFDLSPPSMHELANDLVHGWR
ncbi:hypothetical protein [Streptomyces bacillaris]|uniref:hypothetical protein n=1 Tax=Streptomyces bacillaris TaxID=68179 RepID=UPI003667781A